MILCFLTCANVAEAEKIASALLDKKLVVCAKLQDVKSRFLWKGNRESADETLLIMESHESRFNLLEEEIRNLHSYEQFVLVGIPILHSATGVEGWLKSEMGL